METWLKGNVPSPLPFLFTIAFRGKGWRFLFISRVDGTDMKIIRLFRIEKRDRHRSGALTIPAFSYVTNWYSAYIKQSGDGS